MSSSIKLVYQNKKSLREIQIRRVSANDYTIIDSGERISAYQLKQSYRFMKEKSQMINMKFTAGKKPSMSRSEVGQFRVARGGVHMILDTGKGPSLRKPWEVFWGDELVKGDFPSQAEAVRFIKQKVTS